MHGPSVLLPARLVVPPLPVDQQRREVQAVKVWDDRGERSETAGQAPGHPVSKKDVEVSVDIFLVIDI